MDPRLIRRVRRHDAIANWVITAGGLLVIVCVLGILVLIAKVALPLFGTPKAELAATPGSPVAAGAHVLAVGVDEYLETAYTLTPAGVLTFFRTADGTVVQRKRLAPPAGAGRTLESAQPFGADAYSLQWTAGGLTVLRLRFTPRFDADGTRTIEPSVEVLAERAPPAGQPAPRLVVGRQAGDSGLTVAFAAADGAVRLVKQVVRTNLFGQSTSEEATVEVADGLPAPATHLLLDTAGETLYAALANGHLLRWDVRDPEQVQLTDDVAAVPEGRHITALALLLGDYSVLVGDDGGGLTGWFPYARGEGGPQHLGKVHTLRSHAVAVTAIVPSRRAKSLLSLDADGQVHLDHFTNERALLTLRPEPHLVAVGLNGRGNGLIGLDEKGRLAVWELDVPHPEVSWDAYFAPIWYESYPAPAYVWQSSSGSDDFEPKFSLVPLIFGTLKGTLYGMLFAVPLGVLAAMYTSSLMNPRLRGYIKPAFEIMASIPTVVVGFLAALWLAPIVKSSLTGILLILGVLPLTILAGMVGFELLQNRGWLKHTRGYEFALMIPVIVLGVAAAIALGDALDVVLFSGGLPRWLFDTLGVRVDQRNSIIISMALGFAVLPIIFSISDDALANVPRNLTAASLALGASRWQTVARVILPSASPGVFAALMVGFGRAVGETMIVLMATGNTPIMDWSIFNGMRTLSANIAVEVPEAPVDGTLYRTLFLSAVLLFLTTFVLNSAAEVVRIRLRKKFGQY